MTDLLELYEIAEQEQIEVDCFEMKKREAFSIMCADGECFIAIDPLKLTSATDEKEKLAHELGHCMTGSFYNAAATCDLRQKHENCADRWAIQNLIPEGDFRAAIDSGYTEPWELAELFDVPEPFVRKAICLYTQGNLATELYFETR